MNQRKVAVVIVTLLSAATWTWAGDIKSTTGAKTSRQWVPVEQDVWTTFVEAPEYHFAKARESLVKKDTHTAAAEIREGAILLRFQANRLNDSVSDLYTLAKQVEEGKIPAGETMDEVLTRANKTLDYKEPLVPTAQGEDMFFLKSGRYHVTQAKTKLAAKDYKAAAADIRKAIAYMKLEAARAQRDVSGGFKSALDEMETLAKKAESGADVAAQELDKAFDSARKALKAKSSKASS